MPAFLLTIREGLEAVLIVSIVLGTLRRLGRPELARFVWLGAGAAAALSMTVAGALSLAGVEFEGRGEQIFEGLTLLTAALILTGMLLWMRREGPRLGRRLSAAVQEAAGQTPGARVPTEAGATQYTGITLFGIAFLAVVREGIELALLLAATALESSLWATTVGGLLGLAVAVGTGLLLFQGVVRLNLGRFFQVSSLVLILFAAGMVGLGVHEFIEAGFVPSLVDPVWNLGEVLSDQSTVGGLLRTLFGYTSAPALTQVLAYLGYMLAAGWLLWSRRVEPRAHVG